MDCISFIDYIFRFSLSRKSLQQTCLPLRYGGRMFSIEPLPAPTSSDVPKSYPDHIVGLVDDISKLTLLEVSNLNELLKVSTHYS